MQEHIQTNWQAHKTPHYCQNEIIYHSQQAHSLQNSLNTQVEQVSSVSSRFMTPQEMRKEYWILLEVNMEQCRLPFHNFCRSLWILKVPSNTFGWSLHSPNTPRFISQTSFANKIFDSSWTSGNIHYLWLFLVKEVVNSIKAILFHHHTTPLSKSNYKHESYTGICIIYDLFYLVEWINQANYSGSLYLKCYVPKIHRCFARGEVYLWEVYLFIILLLF